MPDAKKKEGKKKVGGSNISNTEWGMAISLLAIVDAVQFSLDWIGIPFIANVGTVVNRFIDMAVGFAWPTYLYLRGVNLKSTKTVGSILLTFFLEEIPDVDALPLWVADGAFVMATVKAEEKIKEETGVDVGKTAAVVGGAVEGGLKGGLKGAAAGAGKEYAKHEALGAVQDKAAGFTDSNLNPAGGGEENENRETPGEETDEQGREPDINANGKENPAPEGGRRGEQNENKGGGKKKPRAREGGFGPGDGQGLRGAGPGGGGADPLNLRGGSRGGAIADKESDRFHSNLLDLSLSYGQRKKEREENEDETGFPA